MEREAGGHLRNSITKGGGTLTGFIAERGLTEILKLVGCKASIAGEYNFDVRCNLKTLEVKAKKTTVEPKKYYDNSVSNFNARQKADFYVFTRVKWEDPRNEDLGGTLYFCGFVPCVELKKRARFLKKGGRDGDNGYVVKADCWNLRIEECGDWQTFLKEVGAPLRLGSRESVRQGEKVEEEEENRLVKRRRSCPSPSSSSFIPLVKQGVQKCVSDTTPFSTAMPLTGAAVS